MKAVTVFTRLLYYNNNRRNVTWASNQSLGQSD